MATRLADIVERLHEAAKGQSDIGLFASAKAHVIALRAERDEAKAALKAYRTPVMPWRMPELEHWSIVGMNHYRDRATGERRLYVSMTLHRICITADGEDDTSLWIDLARQAREAMRWHESDPVGGPQTEAQNVNTQKGGP